MIEHEERKVKLAGAMEHVAAAIRVCEVLALHGPACHLQLGFDQLDAAFEAASRLTTRKPG